MHVAFVGQMHYFDCAIPYSMQGVNTISRLNINGSFSEPNNADPILDLKDEVDYWFFLRGEFIPDSYLKQLSGKKIWISTEPIERSETMYCMDQGKNRFDAHYHYDKTHIPYLRSKGYKIDSDFQLPVNLYLYKPKDIPGEKWDLGFIGRSTDKRERHFDMFTPRREAYLGALKHNYDFLHVTHGLIGEDLVNILNRIKIHLNLHIDTYRQLQHRMQNIMACNQFVISDPLSHEEDLRPDEHYISFSNASDLLEKVGYYMENKGERDAIAKNAYVYVKKRFDANKCWKELME